MNENKFIGDFSWLFLAALFGLAAGLALMAIEWDLADFAAGFLLGISSVGMGAYIYLAARQQKARAPK